MKLARGPANVCLDTSVWIEFFRPSPKRSALQAAIITVTSNLIDEDRLQLLGPIKLEIFTGLPKKEASSVTDAFKAFQEIIPESEDYQLCYERALIARQKGVTLGATDLLIATLCSRRDLLLWSLDHDFKLMDRLGFVTLFIP